jgi:hypothetical protein
VENSKGTWTIWVDGESIGVFQVMKDDDIMKQVYLVLQMPDYATTNADLVDVLGVFPTEKMAENFIVAEMEKEQKKLFKQKDDMDFSEFKDKWDDIERTYTMKNTSVVMGDWFGEDDE